ncbi:sodium:solute symporter [Microtetraspora sp. NBRC 16547]|uniref:sodium:solute symporter family protein n=1 Tax=Microtetraspora sp. NBRC 16547 TaxID=3030993 RepID=UPI0024A0A3AA|nr:sodium:solute symporter [Microtetraspora sp. NBRC 16547]GLW96634.1 sodium:solute symporter [Microtetraspora sp. NBRC 16547]
MRDLIPMITCAAVVLVASLSALLAARGASGRSRAEGGVGGGIEDWALAGRGYGGVLMCCLLGGTVYTAYTFMAVPGAIFSSGGIGFYALPYTIVICAIAFVLLPPLASIARSHGYVTVADFVRGRYGSPLLSLAVSLTGIFATMPYVALQLLGIRAVLGALGLYPRGFLGDAALTAVFAVLAVSTFRHGLRAPTRVAVVKAVLVVISTIVIAMLITAELGSPATVFARAEAVSGPPLVLAPGLGPAYVSLALGSALALFAFPHVLLVVFSARGSDTLRRTSINLLGWTTALGAFALFGVAAIASAVDPPPGRAELAIPLLVRGLAPDWLTGLLLGALVVTALVPAAVMSIGAATLFARNVYVEFVNPVATAAQETRMAKLMSLFVKVGALAFALSLRDQAAINLHLLGAVWVLQTLPAITLGLLRRAPHHLSLLMGWLLGMVIGTALVHAGGFSPVVPLDIGPVHVQLYAGVVGLAVNLVAVAVTSPLLDRLRVPRGLATVVRVARARSTATGAGIDDGVRS